MPLGATTGNLIVTVGGVPSNPFAFTLTNVPSIFSVFPSLGPVGTPVTISGADFGVTQGSSVVTFNGIPATVSSWGTNGINVIVPAGATTGPVVVNVLGIPTNGAVFTVPGPPNISSLYPSAGLVGQTVTLTGTNFGATQGTSTVLFNITAASVVSWSATQIVVTVPTAVPAGSQTGNVTVTASGVTGTAAYFDVLPAPVISSLSQPFGPLTPVTIAGSAFGAIQGTSTVTFNGVLVTPTSWSATSIVVPAPSGITTGPVVVTTLGIASNGITYPAIASITGLSIMSGVIGNSLTITGTNLSSTDEVVFSDWLGQPSCWIVPTSATNTTVITTVPPCAATGSVEVNYRALDTSSYSSDGITFTVKPSITSFSPNPGTVGNPVQINGGPFGFPQGSSTVTFGGAAVTPTQWQPTYLVVNPPAGFTNGNVVVSVNGVSTPAQSFTVTSNPVISGLSPNAGLIGSTVTIVGTGFGLTQGSSTITFNGVQAVPSGWSNTSIVATVPAGATTGSVVVTVASAASGGVTFTVTPPTISSLSSSSGTVGDPININGIGFGLIQGTSTVTFNGVPATPLTWSATQIFTRPPPNASSGNVVVTVGGIASNQQYFTVVAGPVLTSLTPNFGAPGSSFTAIGSNFGLTQGGTFVNLGGYTATCPTWSNTSITCKVPSNSTVGVQNFSLQDSSFHDSNPLPFTVVLPLQISSLSPSSGVIGGAVTINGTSFGNTQGSSTISFNGLAAAVISWNDTSIMATVPTGATTGNVVVTVGSNTSNGVKFTLVPSPSISGLSPTSGPVGMNVTISGANFGSSQGSSSLTFNGVLATPTSWVAGTINTPVPPGASTGPVLVTVGNGSSAGVTFTVTPGPGITGLSPTKGGIGATVVIAGAGFGAMQGSSTVKFNGTTAVPTNWSDGQITVPVPNGATTGNVVVSVGGTSSNSVSFTLVSGFSVTAVTPNSGITGETVIITGSGFGTSQGSSTLTFNGTKATVISWTNTSLVASVPAAATSGPVVVNVAGANSDGIYFTAQPHILSFSPNPAAVGANITITGENFGAIQGSSAVTCSGVANNINSWSSSSIVVSSCNSTAYGENPIQITVNGVSSEVAALNVVPDPTISRLTPSIAPVGARVLILGQNFGSSQGQSSVTFGGNSATPISWSATGISVLVPAGVTGYSTLSVMVGGMSASVPFQEGTNPPPSSVRITPTGVNLLIGQTKQFTAIDNQGNPRPEATWTVDNPSLVTITADSSPILTALGAGTVNLTATVQGTSLQTQVTISALTSLPVGTTVWSAPSVSGFAAREILQAVPTDFGPGIYSTQTSTDGTTSLIQAYTADGQQLWETTLGALAGNSVPDGNGGLIVMQACNVADPLNSPLTIYDLDPVTGGANWEFSIQQTSGNTDVCLLGLPRMAIRQDGAVVIANPLNVSPALVVVDGQTGQQLPTPTIPASTFTNKTGQSTSCDCFTPVGQPIADSDGSVYVQYTLREDSSLSGYTAATGLLYLLKIAPDGITTTTTQLASTNIGVLWPGSMIPDGNGGVLTTWVNDPADGSHPTFPYQATYVPSGGGQTVTYALPMSPFNIDRDVNTGIPLPLQLVLGENGTAFVSYLINLTSFNLNGGSVNWNYPSPSPTTTAVSILSTADSNGLVGQLSTASGVPTNINFDAAGNTTQSTAPALNVQPWSQGYSLGMMNNPLGEFADPGAGTPPPGWNEPQGGRHKQNKTQLPIIHTFVPFPYTYIQGSRTIVDPAGPTNLINALNGRFDGQAEIRGFASQAATFPAFQNDMNSPIHVLGYIGHSFELGTPATSLGMIFSITDPVFNIDAVIQQDSIGLFSQAANPKVKPEVIAQFQTTPKIVFIAACATQAPFLKLWNITDNVTKGRALIIPDTNAKNVPAGENLYDAATAYTAMLISLLEGNTVEQAKEDANASIPKGRPFVVIGDHNVRIVTIKH